MSDIEAIALTPHPDLVEAVHMIANARYKKEGYAVTIALSEVKAVMEAIYILVKYAQENKE